MIAPAVAPPNCSEEEPRSAHAYALAARSMTHRVRPPGCQWVELAWGKAGSVVLKEAGDPGILGLKDAATPFLASCKGSDVRLAVCEVLRIYTAEALVALDTSLGCAQRVWCTVSHRAWHKVLHAAMRTASHPDWERS